MANSSNGQIIILNGAPRSGKSSIVECIQSSQTEVWINLGVDAYLKSMTPKRFYPGIGLRPGGERPDIEPLVPIFFGALYDSIAAHSRMGLNVITDVGHHNSYSRPFNILADCANRLSGLPVFFVGVRCPIEIIMKRRLLTPENGKSDYIAVSAYEEVPEPVIAWQKEVHDPGIYDLEVDTSKLTPEECAEEIFRKLDESRSLPKAFEKLRIGF